MSLNEDVRTAQDNLRLSASQMGKLQNEFKIVCNENEELKRRLNDSSAGSSKRTAELEEKVILLSAEIQRLRKTGVSQSEYEGSKQKLMEYESK